MWSVIYGVMMLIILQVSRSHVPPLPQQNKQDTFSSNTPETVDVLSMFDAMMSKLESKLKRVESLDHAVHGLIQKLDDNCPSSVINAKLLKLLFRNKKMEKFKRNNHAKIVFPNTDPSFQIPYFNDFKKHMNTMDKKIGLQMTLFSRQLMKMGRLINDVHKDLLLEQDNSRKISKIEEFLSTLKDPLSSVSVKVDEVKEMILGTKNSIENLIPKSEALLSQTSRQERAIYGIHSDLNVKTNKIIQELSHVEHEIYQTSKEDKNSSVPLKSPKKILSKRKKNKTTLSNIVFPSIHKKPVKRVKSHIRIESSGVNKHGVIGYSCADLFEKDFRKSDVYYLQSGDTPFWFLKVFCEMESEKNRERNGGGWTVIQRRGDNFDTPRENFNRPWQDYKKGFGDINLEFWLGNENIFQLTNSTDYEIRIELEDFENNERFASYSSFKIGPESQNYALMLEGYDGNAGDALNDPWYGANLRPFSTFDRDNDGSTMNCASILKGGWWWKSCGRSLNGLYLSNPQDLNAKQGIVWFPWKGWDYSLKRSLIMIRPKKL
ncbi:angiopoietin-1 [Lepeophtheirus salmonis]|uniref:angiopoietin-1 n=1 Tax=Lepeophtheirus salmonis TaxID=72036 RepID=UPI001AEB1948|nr:angiopoietin-1-like [Lepeophtheirus salmonis]